MSATIVGNGGVVAEVDGTTWRSLRVTDRPPDYTNGTNTGGYYRTSLVAATAAGPAAAANLISLRWTSSTLICAIRRIQMQLVVTTTSTAGAPSLGAYVARSFSASDTGGTALTLTGNSFKQRTSMNTTAVGDFRYASAGTLTAGTRTLDSQPFCSVTTALASGSLNSATFGSLAPGDYPLILAQNEGVVWQNITALTAGVYTFGLTLDWAELAAF